MHSSAHGSMGTRALLVRSDRCRTGVHRPRSDRPAEPGATNGLSNSSRLARSSFIPVRYGLLLYLRRMMSVRRCGRGFHRMCSCSSSSAWSQSQFTCRRRRLPSAQSTSARKIQIQNRRRQRIRFICALTGWAQWSPILTGTGHADRGFAGWIPCIQWVTVRPASLGLTGGVIRNEQVAGSILALGSTQTLGNADRPTYRSCR